MAVTCGLSAYVPDILAYFLAPL